MPTPSNVGSFGPVLEQIADDARTAAGWPASAKVYETERRLPSNARGYATVALLPLVYDKEKSTFGSKVYRVTFRIRWRFNDGQERLRTELATFLAFMALAIQSTPGYRYAGVGQLPNVASVDPTDYENPDAPGHDLALDLSMSLTLP